MQTDTTMANQIPDIHSASELRKIIDEMEMFTQETLAEISAIAKITLTSLEVPEAHYRTESFARILSSIANKADSMLDLCEHYAEKAGCSCVDAREKKRRKALAAFLKKYE